MHIRSIYYVFIVLLMISCGNIDPSELERPIIQGSNQSSSIDTIIKLDSLTRICIHREPAVALSFANRMISESLKAGNLYWLGRSYNMKGRIFFSTLNDSSFYYFTLANQVAQKTMDRQLTATVYYNLARVYNVASNNSKAISLLDSSIVYAHEINDLTLVSESYNFLGNIKAQSNDPDGALALYQEALKYGEQANDYPQIAIALTNLSLYDTTMDVSLARLKHAISYLKREHGAEYEMATIYQTMGYLFQNPDSVEHYCNLALSLAELYSFRIIEMGAYNNLVYCFLDKGEFNKAEDALVNHAIPIADSLKNHDWLSTLFDSYADVLVAKGALSKAQLIRDRALEEKIKANEEMALDQVRLLSAILDLKNKETQIYEQNNEIEHQQTRLFNTRLFSAIFILFLLAIIFLILWVYQRRQNKLQKQVLSSAKQIIEIEEEVKNENARELHDITGQLMLGISNMIEEAPFKDPTLKETIGARIAELSDSIRSVSHRMNSHLATNEFTFTEMIEGLVEEYQTLFQLEIQLTISFDEIIINDENKLHIFRILQEMLTNAFKYSRQSEIWINLSMDKDHLVITYQDNGVGFDLQTQRKPGMGIRNISDRVKLMGGKATLASSIGKGTSWNISIPKIQ